MVATTAHDAHPMKARREVPRVVSKPVRERMTTVLKSLYLKAFPLFERLGVHVTPRHYTQPIPDTAALDPGLWERRSALPGIDMREAQQLELLRSVRDDFAGEYDRLEDDAGDGFRLENPYFGPVDAEMLYCMIRRARPRRICEIGSGYSTRVSALALARNAAAGAPGRIDSYDPYPGAATPAASPTLAVHATPAERIPPQTFDALAAGDVLFVDSTHVVKIGGDVVFLFLEILPRLQPGVLVHVHDIFLPCDYPKEWILRHRLFWTEQYLLQAFLAFNDAFEVLWAGGYMHVCHPRELAAAFRSYDPATVRPGSFWMRKAR